MTFSLNLSLGKNNWKSTKEENTKINLQKIVFSIKGLTKNAYTLHQNHKPHKEKWQLNLIKYFLIQYSS